MSELTELQTKVEALESKLADKEKELDGLQSLKGKWSNEVGDVRKKTDDLTSTIASLKAALDEVKGDRDALKAEIESLKSKGTEGKSGQPPPAPKPSAKDEADRLESELTDDEKKLVEKVLASDEDKASFVSDDNFRAAVLKRVRAESGDGGPSSIWRVKKQASSDDLLTKVDKMFSKHKGQDTSDGGKGRFGQPRVIKAADGQKPVKFV